MPALRLKSIDANKALTISKELVDELQELIQCPRNYFSIELGQARGIVAGKLLS